MFSKDINSGELNYIYSEENFLDINKVKTTKTKKKEEDNKENNNKEEDNKYSDIFQKLEIMDYKSIFEDKFIEDFIQNDLEIFEKKIQEKNEKEEIPKINKSNKEKEEEKTKKMVEDKFNLIRIYIDLKNLYDENIGNNLLNDKFKNYINNIKIYEKREELFKNFDSLCQNIKLNLFSEIGNDFSDKFFQNISPKILKFLNRFHMIRLFFAIKNKEKNIEKLTIINEISYITKEILSNIIMKMINIYGNYNPDISKKVDKNFIEEELEYFNILLDYFYFENIFVCEREKRRQNEDKSIYGKYISYYDKLSVFNNDNYSYINEYKWENRYDEEYEKWNKYIKEEYENEGLNIFYNLLYLFSIKRGEGIFFGKKTEFYSMIFFLLHIMMEEEERDNNIIELINGIIKIILSDEKRLFENYLDEEKTKENNIFKLIIKKIKDNLNNYYENKEYNMLEDEYLNSLIILLESFGEYRNDKILEYIFNKDEDIKSNSSVFDILIELYEKILIELNDTKEYDAAKKNKLIILNSVSNCIIEFIELSNINNKKKVSKKNTIIKDFKNDDNKSKIKEIIEGKMKNLKTSNLKNIIKDKEDSIYDMFIIENHLQINIHLIKTLKCSNFSEDNELNYLMQKININNSDDAHKLAFYKTLNFMNRCFKSFLKLQKIKLKYEQNSIYKIRYEKNPEKNNKSVNKNKIKGDIDEEKILDIKDDIKYLFDKYKIGRLNEVISLEQDGWHELTKYRVKKELLVLIYLNYQKIFYLINSETINLKQFEYFLYINDDVRNIKNVKNLLDYFFGHTKHRLIILFSFLQKIHDIIEINIDNKPIKQLNRLNPEYLEISTNSMNYFSTLIDYKTAETKLLTIYNYIECIIYDINRRKWQKYEHPTLHYIFYPQRNWKFINYFSINTYEFWKFFNWFLFVAVNIFLVIKYAKSRNKTGFEYNQIDNDQNFLVTKIWPFLHIALFLAFLIYWLISRGKVEYFFAMTKFINEYFEDDAKLTMDEKSKLLNKEKSDFYINKFFPKKRIEKIDDYFNESNIFTSLKNILGYVYIYYIKFYLYTLKTVFPFILSIVSLCLTIWSQIFYIIPLFLFFNLFETLTNIFLLFADQWVTLFLITIYFLIILYIFNWLAFLFLPRMFTYEAVDRNNELLSFDYTEENICSSTVSCMFYFLNFGFRDSLMDQNLISFKNETGYYFIQFFFNIFLYIFIHLIFDNIFLVTISNAFDEMKNEMYKIDNKKENVCFICNKTRNDCIKDYENFEGHLKEHDMWKYIRYICCIILKKRNQYTDEEYQVWKQIKNKEIKWFPNFKENKEEEEKEEDEEN